MVPTARAKEKPDFRVTAVPTFFVADSDALESEEHMARMPKNDLNLRMPVRRWPPTMEAIYEPRPTRILADHGFCPAPGVPEVCQPLPGRLQGQRLLLLRPVRFHDLWAVDPPGQSPRFGHVPWCPSGRAVPHGHPNSPNAKQSGQCQRPARLADYGAAGFSRWSTRGAARLNTQPSRPW